VLQTWSMVILHAWVGGGNLCLSIIYDHLPFCLLGHLPQEQGSRKSRCSCLAACLITLPYQERRDVFHLVLHRREASLSLLSRIPRCTCRTAITSIIITVPPPSNINSRRTQRTGPINQVLQVLQLYQQRCRL
jgi:hypothetical protein